VVVIARSHSAPRQHAASPIRNAPIRNARILC
jgi:hypothetical protein